MVKTIWNDILTAIRQYMPYAITSGLFVSAIVLLTGLIVMKDRSNKVWKRNLFRSSIFLITYCYSYGVASVTFMSREPGTREGIDLRLFSTFGAHLMDNIYPVENVILFIPLGLLLPVLSDRLKGFINCMTIAALFSLMIESAQLITKRGYYQIDDIVTNSLGAMLGYGLYRLTIKIVSLLSGKEGSS